MPAAHMPTVNAAGEVTFPICAWGPVVGTWLSAGVGRRDYFAVMGVESEVFAERREGREGCEEKLGIACGGLFWGEGTAEVRGR